MRAEKKDKNSAVKKAVWLAVSMVGQMAELWVKKKVGPKEC